MEHRGRWIAGVGCLVLVAVVALTTLIVVVASRPSVPKRAILSIGFDGPIVEVTTEDPFAELFGEAPLSLRDLHLALNHAAEDDRIVGVRVRMSSFGGGFATAQEVRRLLRRVSHAGKWTAVYMDTAGEFAPGNIQYFVASACDEVSLNPLGDVNLVGLSVASPFIRGTLDKLNIKPEFPGRGDYKSARFMYTKREFTPAHREMMEWILDSTMTQLVEGIADSRHLEPDRVERIIDEAPHLGQEAVDVGLVDHLEDWTGFRERLKEKADEGEASVLGMSRYLQTIHRDQGAKIAVVTATGAIVRGESGRSLNPLFGGELMGSETIAEAWRDVRRSSGIKAAVFRVDSPGGSAVASEIIRREMLRTAEDIPVVVSMANLAASGGYWVTCGADKIVADPGTLTASIGVFGGHLNTSGFWEDKLGVTFGRLERGAHANIYGDLDDWSDEERAEIDRLLDRIYDDFIERVADSRDMTLEDVDAVGRGRVFTGAQALDRGLVDELGGFDRALELAKDLGGVAPESSVRLVDFPRPLTWWQRMIQKQHEREAFVEMLQTSIMEGRVNPPGVVWMPPMIIQ